MWSSLALCCLTLSCLPGLIITKDTSMIRFAWNLNVADFLEKKNGEYINSSEFTTYNHSVEQHWKLLLYPHGNVKESQKYISIYLCYQDVNPIEVEFEFYLLTEDITEEPMGAISSFSQDSKCLGFQHFIEQDTVMGRAKNSYMTISIVVGIQSDPVPLPDKVQYDAGRTKCLYSQWLNKSYTDLTLVAGQSEWVAHKVILASQSSVFDEMLSDYTEHPAVTIHISDEECADVGSMLEFVYSGSVKDFANVTDLCTCGHHFNITSLKSYCEVELKHNITCDNSTERLILSHKYDSHKLKAILLHYIFSNKCPVKNGDGNDAINDHPDLLIEMIDYMYASLDTRQDHCNE